MDTLFLTILSQKTEVVSRDKLYFDTFEHCVDFMFQDLPALRLQSHEEIETYLERQLWRREVNFGGSWRWRSYGEPITTESAQNCHNIFDKKKKIKTNHKLVISLNCGYLYTNDLEDVSEFLQSPGVTIIKVRSVSVDRPRNSLIVKSAKHNLRTYFKSQHVTIDQKQNLIRFLSDRTDIRISPGMSDWITKWEHHKYIADNYFIDHNDDGFLTMLALVSPIKIKKTVTLLTE